MKGAIRRNLTICGAGLTLLILGVVAAKRGTPKQVDLRDLARLKPKSIATTPYGVTTVEFSQPAEEVHRILRSKLTIQDGWDFDGYDRWFWYRRVGMRSKLQDMFSFLGMGSPYMSLDPSGPVGAKLSICNNDGTFILPK
ncbi:MAG: hypothetical protein ABL962_01060 [Fimbriimonadaceae bacterium]